MNPRKTYWREARSLTLVMAILASGGLGIFVWSSDPILAEDSGKTGVIGGRVTADRGEVRAFRVQAKDTVHRMAYTVFTNKGQYQIFNLPPSSYEVQVLEIGFDSPAQRVELKSGDSKTVELAVKANGVRSPRGEGAFGPGGSLAYAGTPATENKPGANGEDVELVDFDTLYPPSPARDVMMKACFGCHGANGDSLAQRAWHRRLSDERGWRTRVDRMFIGGKGGMYGRPIVTPDEVSPEQKESIIKYLAANFGLNSRPRDLKLDPLVRDEAALAQAIYIEYEGLTGHDPVASVARPGVVYLSDLFKNQSIVAIDTRNLDYATRQKEWRIPSADNQRVMPHGLIELKGHVFWVENGGDGHVGELNPKTGDIRQYPTPTKGAAAHTLRGDSQGNIWYSYFTGVGKIGRFDAGTREIQEFEPPARGFNGYGIIVDRKDRVWCTQIGVAANRSPAVQMYDPKTLKWAAYPTSSPTRRLTVDSKGTIWANQYFGNRIVEINPASGKVTEYPLPLKYGNLYEIWADLEDNIWASNSVYNSLVKFDQKTKAFTYYPFPEFRTHVPKMDVDSQGTMWFGLDRFALAGFKPKGNVPMK
jgi:virginiamycin B lyase